jgi:stage IV sporulation protein FB
MFRFTFLGFPVRVDWTFWLVSALMSGAISMTGRDMFVHLAVWIGAVFVSILWHELGHAQAFKKYGGHAEILLYSMGGLCIPIGKSHHTRHESMWISAAGPGASLFLFGVVLAVHWFTPLGSSSRIAGLLIGNLLWINGFWTLVNLLPVLPLDGGQIFQAFMSNKNPSIVPQVGMVVAGLVAIYGFYIGLFFMAIFFIYLAHSNWQRSQGTHGGFW